MARASENEIDSESERQTPNHPRSGMMSRDDFEESEDSGSEAEESSPSKWNEPANSSESEDTSYSYSNAMLEDEENEEDGEGGEVAADSSEDSEYEDTRHYFDDFDEEISPTTIDLNNG